MKHLYELLSGNVTGGIGLYLFLVSAIFLSLYGISRRNELFTTRHFRIWFGAIWLLLTVGYVYLWTSDPPPQILSRYSTHITFQDSSDRWLAYYFRDELTERMQPAVSRSQYLFPQRWAYLADVDCAKPDQPDCRRIIENLPVNKLLVGRVGHENGQAIITLSVKFKGGEQILPARSWAFSDEAPEIIIPQILTWMSKELPIRQSTPPRPVQRELIMARDAFYRGDYHLSQNLCRKLPGVETSGDPARDWFYYNEVRLAAGERRKSEPANPFETRKVPWQRRLGEARAYLLQRARGALEQNISDPMLFNMTAESYLEEELFGDAETFLKLAYSQNPFDLDVLRNLNRLHPSRLDGLPLNDREDLLEQILDICPLDEKSLSQYVDRLLSNLAISQAPSGKIEARIQRLLNLNPSSARGWVLEGRYWNEQFDYHRALRAFLKADSLQPGVALHQFNIGVTYFKLNQMEQAESAFRQAVALGNLLDSHLYLGVILKERGEYQKALEEFRYRVAHKTGDDDYYAVQAMKGIRECLDALHIQIPATE